MLEDPLSEDILRGSFHGFDIIKAELVANGEGPEKKIIFVPSKKESVEVLPPAKEAAKEETLTASASMAR